MKYIDSLRLEYRDLKENGYLYDDIDLEANDIVDAQYARVHGYEGNPDICALPFARNIEKISDENYIIPSELSSFYEGEFVPQHNNDWVSLIAATRRLRVPFPYQVELEATVYSALKEVYASRKISVETRDIEIEGAGAGQKVSLKYRSMTPCVIPNPPGFCLLATSGHGKSASIELMSRHFPKAIRHDGYIQIPILYLTAFGNRNVTELLKSAARKIDQILDSGQAYQKQVEKLKSPAAIAEQLVRWIQTFHIGMIIIDEIQYLEFGKTSDSGSGPNTFANIIHVTEESGVALGVIGNVDAMTHWRSVLRDMRRLEVHKIYIDTLSADSEFTERVVRSFWKYQVFREKVELRESMCRALIEESCGSIDLLALLIMAVEHEAIFSTPKVDINADFIKKVAKKRFARMQELIKADNDMADREYCNARNEVEVSLQSAFNDIMRKEMLKSVTDSLRSKEKTNRCEEIQHICNQIQACYPDVAQIVVQRAYDELDKKSPGFSALAIKTKTPLVMKLVQAQKDNRKRRTEKVEQLLQQIEEMGRDDTKQSSNT